MKDSICSRVCGRELHGDHRLQRAAERGEVDLGVEAADHARLAAARARAPGRSTARCPRARPAARWGCARRRPARRGCGGRASSSSLGRSNILAWNRAFCRTSLRNCRCPDRTTASILRYGARTIHAHAGSSATRSSTRSATRRWCASSRLGAGLTPQIVAKVEALNPGGSIKDRVAVALIEAAERDGLLQPGGTIVEPTSGNTGTGLAIAARLKGYRVIAVMPDKMSREKIDLLRAYGAEVVVCPTNVEPESPESYYSVADRLAAEIPGAFKPNQYFNPANPRGPLRVDRPRDLGADRRADHPPRRRRRHGRDDHRHRPLPQGAQPGPRGHRRRPRRLDLQRGERRRGQGLPRRGRRRGLLARDVRPRRSSTAGCTCRDKDSFLTTRRLAMTEGILAGGSCGTALRRGARGRGASIDDPEALDRGDPARRRALLPEQDLQRRLDDPVRVPRARRRPDASATSCAASTARARSRRWSRCRPTRRSATPSRCCTSTASRSCRSSAPTTRARSSARSASAACSSTPSTTRRCSAAEIVRVMEPPLHAVAADDPVREAVELLVGDRQALLVIEDGRAGRASSRAPTCSRRWPNETTAIEVRHQRGPRRARARPDLRLGHPGDPPDLDLPPARASASSSRTTTTRARPTRRARRSSARSASSRAGTAARSRPAWRRRTR